MMGGGSSDLVAFGRFRFDRATGELFRDGHVVHLAPKPARVLTLLLDAPGRLVTRRELELDVWGEQPIDLNRSLNFAVPEVRSALGDRADDPTYVETLPKRGYRFIAPVSESRTNASNGPSGRFVRAEDPAPGPARASSGRLVTSLAVSAMLLAVVAVVVAGRARLEGADPGVRSGAEGLRPMLAVLPFEPRGDEDALAPFASGLADELITRISRLDPDRLGVVARVSAGRAVRGGGEAGEVAANLGAAFLLRGSVTAMEDGVRVTARLVDRAGAVVWAQRYVVSSPTSPTIEYEIASRVAQTLQVELGLDLPDVADPGRASATPESRDAYLRGAYLLDSRRDRLDDAVELLRAAVRLDPTHARAHSDLGRGLLRQRRTEEAREHLRSAIEVDPTLGEPHVQLGVDALYTRWEMGEARMHFERALSLEPGNVLSHHPYAYLLSIAGEHEAAIAEMEVALRLDPISPLVNGDVGRVYYRAGRFDEAERHCRRTLELVATNRTALSCLVNLHLLQGEPSAAIPFALRTLALDGVPAGELEQIRALPEGEAVRAYFERRLVDLRQNVEQGHDARPAVAQAYVFLGRFDEAIDELEIAFEEKSGVLPQVPGDPCFAVLIGHPRFDALVLAMGLTEG